MPAFRPHQTDTVDEAWDAGAQEKKVLIGESRSYYAKIYAWYDPDLDEGNKGTYKFIHHEVSDNGDLEEAVIRACTTGIGVLNGGMGGTTIPAADRQGVYDHLAKHLRDAGREPPELNGSANSTGFEVEPIGIVNHFEIIRQAQAELWAIMPTALQALLTSGGILRADVDRVIEVEALSKPGPKSGGVARIPIMGAITRRESLWSMMFGGSSVERITKALREAAATDSISTVVLDIDSPGGTVSGIPELAAEVRSLKQSKHVVALANSLTASAAYWIASQADEIIATPEALVGSVGVFSVHEDWSKYYDHNGIKITYISAGRHKVDGNFDEPLSDEARVHMQAIVDDAYNLFVADVAKGRSISTKEVRDNYGEGRVLTANAARAVGMIDRIAGADETLRRLMGIRAEHESPIEALIDAVPESAVETEQVVNSQARIALMRRRLELAQRYFHQED